VRISSCHDFQWSRGLWRKASLRIVKTATVCLLCYVGVASLLAFLDGVRGVDIPYFIAACVTTVGLGDIAPKSQLHRGATVLVLPFGLVIISLCLAAVEASANTSSPHAASEDFDEDMGESEAEIRNSRSLRKMAEWYQKKNLRNAHVRQELAKILLQYLLTLGIGCTFFLVSMRERRLQEQHSNEDMTVVDAFFFASVVATSVGYGHRIVPQTHAAKGFLAVYFFSTVVVGAIVGKLVTITFSYNEKIVEDYIVRETTWVHRTALLTDNPNEVSEADFLIFKLLQLQRVDEDILHRLQLRFEEVDLERSGSLEVGVEVPSAEQVELMAKAAHDAGAVPDEVWFQEKWFALRPEMLNMRQMAVTATVAVKLRKSLLSPKNDSPRVFPEVMAPVILTSVDTACCFMTNGGTLEFVASHQGFMPLEKALDSFFALRRGRPDLSPVAPITLDGGSRKLAGIPLEASHFSYLFPVEVDQSLIEAKAAETPSGPCLLALYGGFVYFDKHKRITAINAFEASQLENIPKRAAVLEFEDPLALPPEAMEALALRFRPVTLPFMLERGAVDFTWIHRGESLPGISSPTNGAFAYVFMGGDCVYFPVASRASGVTLKLSEIHNFSFSRSLWYDVYKDMLKRGALLLALYVLVGYYAICKTEGWDPASSWYFLSISFTTVGYGDYAPTKQVTRAISIVLLPLGLIIVGFAISASQAFTLSKPSRKHHDATHAALSILDPKKKQKALAKLVFKEAAFFDVDGNGQLSREELFQMAPSLDLTKDKANKLFDQLDVDQKGYIEASKEKESFLDSLAGRVVLLCMQVYYPVLFAAVFFKIPALTASVFGNGLEDSSMTWIDSLYFATVTATTVGFGDITPRTSGGKVFIALYIIVTCVWVASVLGQFIDLYVNDYIGEQIIGKIINSTTFVHKSDVAGNGRVSLPEYLLYKLQELQMVDKKILDLLSARFDELDDNNSLSLEVGVDIPSAEQVARIQEELAWWTPTHRTVMDAWEVMQKKIDAKFSRKTKMSELRQKWQGVKAPPPPPPPPPVIIVNDLVSAGRQETRPFPLKPSKKKSSSTSSQSSCQSPDHRSASAQSDRSRISSRAAQYEKKQPMMIPIQRRSSSKAEIGLV